MICTPINHGSRVGLPPPPPSLFKAFAIRTLDCPYFAPIPAAPCYLLFLIKVFRKGPCLILAEKGGFAFLKQLFRFKVSPGLVRNLVDYSTYGSSTQQIVNWSCAA